MSVYADLVQAMEPCVDIVADHCLNTGLISEAIYDRFLRLDLLRVQKARILLRSIKDAISEKAESLHVFIAVLTNVGGFESLVHKIKVHVYLAVLL